MRIYTYLALSLLFSIWSLAAKAQPVKGQVIDMTNGNNIAGVAIFNVHQNSRTVSAADGTFSINAAADELIEFSKPGYKAYKVRMPKGKWPPFFKIGLERPAIDPNIAANGPPTNYHDDSLRYYNLYKRELEFEKFTLVDMMKHPFSAMSKRNRQIWAFQDEFSWFQQEKYINYTFSKQMVTNITGMTGDSLITYMHMFRPTYNDLRAMTEYEFYAYVRKTGELFRRRGPRAKMSPVRGSR
jgi:hypothetical protein